MLNAGRIEALVAAFAAFPTLSADLLDALRTEADYFKRNKERRRYPKFRKLGLFVGSGVIDAGCKTVIESRLKRSGMFWTVRGQSNSLHFTPMPWSSAAGRLCMTEIIC